MRARTDLAAGGGDARYAKYLRQAAFPYSRSYIVSVLGEHHLDRPVTRHLFEALFDPRRAGARRAAAHRPRPAEVAADIDALVSLDTDRILRRSSLVQATLRTNTL